MRNGGVAERGAAKERHGAAKERRGGRGAGKDVVARSEGPQRGVGRGREEGRGERLAQSLGPSARHVRRNLSKGRGNSARPVEALEAPLRNPRPLPFEAPPSRARLRWAWGDKREGERT